jgi:transaldolase
MNPLLELPHLGQSVWLDEVSRSLIAKGELAQLIREDDLRGVTSNPTIFEKAISGSSDYDEQIWRLVGQGKTAPEILDLLIADDIRNAADIFRPVYETTHGLDGYVSIECAPSLAFDTTGTINETRRLANLIDRKNIMIKIPGTRDGLPAIQQMIAEGYNINITLLFSIERYEAVVEAYLSGLEQRVSNGGTIDTVNSVASFFVSRVDTAVDKLIELKMEDTTNPAVRAELESLLGKAGIANARLAYQKFKSLFQSERFQNLKNRGANVQRVLWASTSMKDPDRPDTLYVDELIGHATVNTMPLATLQKFKDDGHATPTLDAHADEARQVVDELALYGIDLKEVTAKLEEAGVKSFSKSYDALIDSIELKRQLVATGTEASKSH